MKCILDDIPTPFSDRSPVHWYSRIKVSTQISQICTEFAYHYFHNIFTKLGKIVKFEVNSL